MSYTSAAFARSIRITRDQLVSHALWCEWFDSPSNFDLCPTGDVDGIPPLSSAHGRSTNFVAEPLGDDDTLFLGEALRIEHECVFSGTTIIPNPPCKADVADPVKPLTRYSLRAVTTDKFKDVSETRIARGDCAYRHFPVTVINRDVSLRVEAMQEVGLVLRPRKLFVAVCARQPWVFRTGVRVDDRRVAEERSKNCLPLQNRELERLVTLTLGMAFRVVRRVENPNLRPLFPIGGSESRWLSTPTLARGRVTIDLFKCRFPLARRNVFGMSVSCEDVGWQQLLSAAAQASISSVLDTSFACSHPRLV